MSDSNSSDSLQSLIARILDAESRGENVDCVTFCEQHPEHAASIKAFLANHSSMKVRAAEIGVAKPTELHLQDRSPKMAGRAV